MTEHSIRFTHAITRAPGNSITKGLRAVDTGLPDLALMRAHHAAYVAALREAGAVVIELPALEDFPDAVFVEDTALCLPEGAVIMRPGAPTRLGEAAEMAPHLEELYSEVRWIGDVRSDPSPTFSPALVTSLANKFADLITAR